MSEAVASMPKNDEPETSFVLDRMLTMELARVTERAAVSSARWRGRGDEKGADQAAVDAMRRELNSLPISGTVVIGEGERDEAPMLYIGEEVGSGGQKVDIALDPLECTTICAKNLPNSLAVIAMAQQGSLLNAPDVYMDKIAIGPGYEDGLVDLDLSPSVNIQRLAEAKGVATSEITACILDRQRHAALIEEVRKTGASIRLIPDGDIAGVIHTTNWQETGIDIYMGTGGAPEGVLAAAALRCVGGQIRGRLILDTEEKRARAKRMGVDDPHRQYSMGEMAGGDVIFSATGVTDGNLLSGVKFNGHTIETETLVMRSSTKTVRTIKTRHTRLEKFHLD
jgi:fructose-1,6-bisphosphatase II / sedoheptulose-1,7-bisphosphatase